MERLRFLKPRQVKDLAQLFGTPCFVYSRSELELRADEALQFPNSFGLTVRYAMKANSNSTILKILKKKGIHIDASSEHEVERALHSGFKPEEIMLSSQELAKNLKTMVDKGVIFNACSLRQLESYGRLFQGTNVSVRFNPGMGSGGTKKTNVGGPTSSFGIWHEYLDKVNQLLHKYKLNLIRVHTHIGSGSDPEIWKDVAKYTFNIVEQYKSCEIVDLGGGFKVARMSDEKATDLQVIGQPIQQLFIDFYEKTGRKLKLEIEPGTFFMANTGCIIASVDDLVDTGKDGYNFCKLDTGMDTNTRPSLYGSMHPMIPVSTTGEEKIGTPKEYVIVGHCCESGDLFTQEMGGGLTSRILPELQIGDYMVIEGSGAYCSSMSTKNYNSYPEAAEVLVDEKGQFHLIRKKQFLNQMIQNEMDIIFG
jgi:diaminopimelate decarboxylase